MTRFSGQNSTFFFLQNCIRYYNDFFAWCSFIPQDKKYIYIKSSKKIFRGIGVLERDLDGNLEPKCGHDFSIPGQLKQKSAT